jgi:hypothetical protein
MGARMRAAVLAAVLLGAGCTSGSDAVLEAWRKAGQTPGTFSDAGSKLEGGKCRAGSVSGLSVTLCEFESEEAAKKGAEAGWELVGNTVGSSLASGKLVLVVADPRKEDPAGRRIDSVVRTFQAETR